MNSRSSKLRILYSSLLLLLALAPHVSAAEDVIDIGSRREIFVDRFLIDTLQGARLELHEPRDEGPVLKFDHPWEGAFSAYVTVIKDGPIYRAYYRGLPDGQDASEAVTCYAESSDGIHWAKPELGLFDVGGSTRNNIILANAGWATHNFSPFSDNRRSGEPGHRYLALGGLASLKNGGPGLFAYTSGDGIHWTKMHDQPVFKDTGAVFDSQNVSFWSPLERRYVLYYRKAEKGIRAVARATSEDFLHWSAGAPMTFSDTNTEIPSQHLYTNQTAPYFRAPHIYLSTAARFMPNRRVLTAQEAAAIHVNPKYFNDTSDSVLMSTRGGLRYDRTFLGALIRPGIGPHNWVSRTNYPALNIVQTGPTEMSMYANCDYGQPTAHLRRYSMRLDGLASIHATFEGGTMLTRPFTFSGNQLHLNFATSAAGGIRIEIQDPAGKPLPGFSLADCRELIGNEIDRAASWNSDPGLNTLAGKPIRLHLQMKDADLYSIKFE